LLSAFCKRTSSVLTPWRIKQHVICAGPLCLIGTFVIGERILLPWPSTLIMPLSKFFCSLSWMQPGSNPWESSIGNISSPHCDPPAHLRTFGVPIIPNSSTIPGRGEHRQGSDRRLASLGHGYHLFQSPGSGLRTQYVGTHKGPPPPPPSHQHPHQTSSPIAHPFPSSSVSKPLPSLLAPTPSQPHKAPKLKHDYALQRCRFACELCWEVCRRATS